MNTATDYGSLAPCFINE